MERKKIISTLFGFLVSEVVCKKEAEKRGREHPRYASTRFIITKVLIGGTMYNLDRFANVGHAGRLLNVDLDEERLILEVSLILERGIVKPSHQHMTGLTETALYALPLVDIPYVRKGHTTEFTTREGRNILTYFMKAWGEYIQEPELITDQEKEFLNATEAMSCADLILNLIPTFTLPQLVLN